MLITAIAQLVLVVSGICAARILGTDERGQLALFALVPTLLVTLMGFGTPIAITYYLARYSHSRRYLLRLSSRLFLGQGILVLAAQAIILVILYGDDSNAIRVAAAATLLIGPGELAQDYGTAIFQGEGRFLAFNLTRLSPVVLYAGTVLTLLILGDGSLMTVTASYVGATVVSGALTMGLALSGRRIDDDTEGVRSRHPRLREILTFGGKSMFGAVYPTETFKIDQAFVGFFLSKAALGYYVVALSFVNLPRFASQSVGMVAYPHIAAIDDRDAARKSVWKFVFVTGILSTVLCIGIALAAPWIVPFAYGHEFSRAVPIVQLLLISSGILAVRRVLSDCMRGAGFPLLGTVAEIAGLVAMLPLLAIWVPGDGTTGAAIALALAAAVGLLVLLVGVIVAERSGTRTVGAVEIETPGPDFPGGG